jgi:hypothetical protein
MGNSSPQARGGRSMNLDRFAMPLASEGFTLSPEAIEEQLNLSKRDIIYNYINSYLDTTNELPGVEDIQETFYKIDLYSSMIQDELNEAKRSWKL